jgi:hypothetical protein
MIASLDIENMTRDELQEQLTSVGYLADHYLLWMREFYVLQRKLVQPTSDLILEWEQSAEDLAKSIIKALAEAELT